MTKSINAAVKDSFVNAIDKSMRKEIELSNYVRNETLDRAYATEGYVSMTLAEQTAIYNAKRAEIIAELGLDW